MGTVVFYTDESGSTEPFACPIQNGKTPIFSLSSLALPLTRWREIDRSYNSLKANFFPDELARKGRKEEIEIKGNDLCSPRNTGSSRRREFLSRVLNLLGSIDAKIFAVTFVKSPISPISSRSIYTHGFQILLERFNHYLEHSDTYDSGIIICDSRSGAIRGNGLDKEVAKSYQSYIFGNPKGQKLTKMHESPLFADSRITVGIQLADIVSSVIYANHYYYYAKGLAGAIDYSHMKGWWPRIDALEYKCRSRNKSEELFGIRVIDHN